MSRDEFVLRCRERILMRTLSVRTATVICVLVAATGTVRWTAADSRGLGDDPAAFDQLIDAAFVTHDVAFFTAVAADDARFTHGETVWNKQLTRYGGTTVWNKQQLLNAVRMYKGLARNVDTVEVERHGDFVETLGPIQVKTGDAQRPEYQIYFVRLYAHRATGWQFLSHRTVRQVDGPEP